GFFEKGEYIWKGHSQEIKALSFHFDQKHLDLYVQTPIFGKEFGVNLNILPFDHFQTVVEAFEMIDGEVIDPQNQALLAKGSLLGPDGITISRMQGNLFGFEFEFLPIPNSQDAFSLGFIGNIAL